MLQAGARGDADACRAAMDSLRASPEAGAWLKSGHERLLAHQTVAVPHEATGFVPVGEPQYKTAQALSR